jgi:undecaprenyl diphosphate synthase
MDGNRRWAKERNLPILEGHRAGYEKLKDVLKWCRELGVEHLVVYAFSKENWNRKKDEVNYLLDLLRHIMKEQTEHAVKEKIRLLFPGDLSQFPADIQEILRKAVDQTKDFHETTFSVALSYGGRAEVIDAIRRIPLDRVATIQESEFEQLLWTRDIPDPDMIIRTSGEKRLSGFLTWKSVYSELFFTDTFWPSFSKDEFAQMIFQYGERERRYGK